jgi:hypothetical protein
VPPAPGDSDWSSEAIYDLARVRDGSIQDVPHCQEGMPNFTKRWLAIDAWGKPVGQVEGRMDGIHRYALVSGNRGVGVYVLASAWSAAAAARGEVSAAERAAHDEWLRSLDPPVKEPKVEYFQTRPPSKPAKLAVSVSRDALIVSRRASPGKWELAHAQRASDAEWPLFEHRAIVHMNGDGVPEVIAHFNEQSDGRGYELVLASSNGGLSFQHVADNEDTCP